VSPCTWSPVWMVSSRRRTTLSPGWIALAASTKPEFSISEEEAAAFVKTIDCYVLGSRTYEHALELGWPYGDTPAVVVTDRKLPPARNSVEFYSGDLKTLVDVKLGPRYRNIWLVGGAMLCQRFLELGLVDEIKLTIAPVLLGEGLRLFDGSLPEERWEPEECRRLQERICRALVLRLYGVKASGG